MASPNDSHSIDGHAAQSTLSEAPTGGGPVAYDDLPPRYHRWKWQVLIAFCVFYLFLYTGRFNFWPTSPLIKEALDLSHIEIGIINAMLLWGFMVGDLVHGRLAEAYGLRLWVAVGAVLTTVFNWTASFGTSTVGFAIPWFFAGFVNAACWAPAISLISQWWPRRERGIAMGIIGTTTGGAMLVMWWLSSFVAARWGWQAAFRYPPLIILVLGIAFYFVARDRPRDVNLPEYIEEDEISAEPESVTDDQLKGLGPYKLLLANSRFQLACHVKGLGKRHPLRSHYVGSHLLLGSRQLRNNRNHIGYGAASSGVSDRSTRGRLRVRPFSQQQSTPPGHRVLRILRGSIGDNRAGSSQQRIPRRRPHVVGRNQHGRFNHFRHSG